MKLKKNFFISLCIYSKFPKKNFRPNLYFADSQVNRGATERKFMYFPSLIQTLELFVNSDIKNNLLTCTDWPIIKAASRVTANKLIFKDGLKDYPGWCNKTKEITVKIDL